jgi:hypothetical protein
LQRNNIKWREMSRWRQESSFAKGGLPWKQANAGQWCPALQKEPSAATAE